MKVGVVGAGTMGRGIAQVALVAGHEVCLYDEFDQAKTEARDSILHRLNRSEEKGKLREGQAKVLFGRLYLVEHLEDLHDSEIVFEAIHEDMCAKVILFEKLNSCVSSKCIIATNTSSLSIDEMSGRNKWTERFIGIHFFNPAPLIKLVEIVPGNATSKLVLARSKDILTEWGKTVVLAKDSPGFIVNRIARPFYGEALIMLEEGMADVATIDNAMKQQGFRMGPFELMDLIGIDVNYRVNESIWKATYLDPRYKPSLIQKKMMVSNRLGRKTGNGFYSYPRESASETLVADSTLARLVFSRIRIMLINEAADALCRRIATKEHIELAMTEGVNYPRGLLSWADKIGIPECVHEMDLLYDFYHQERYRCSPLLRSMAAEGKCFFL